MEISQKIKHLRDINLLSQTELADALSVSRQTIYKWETGEAIPQTEKIIEICRLFKVSADVLVNDNIDINDGVIDLDKHQEEPVYFSTNGYRGEANKELTSDTAYKIGRFLGWYYSNPRFNKNSLNKRPSIVIGKDTRRSSYMFEYAIAGGAASSGADVYMMHVTTTPSVGFVVFKEQFDCGVMITASHNPSYDNGVKLVDRNGELLDTNLLYLLESYLDNDLKTLGISDGDLPFAKRVGIGIIKDYEDGRNKYIDYLLSLSKYSFRDLKIGVDTGNGASYMIAKRVFEELGAQLHIINDNPDGININDNAGSTHIGNLCKFVKENSLDVGFAFDGDADRCIAVDENGEEVNGDKIMYLLANKLKRNKWLYKDTIVLTEMSNTGLLKALKRAKIKTVVSDVGERNVLEKMIRANYSLGGEQSGHILLRKFASISDGIIASLLIVDEILETNKKLSELVSSVTLVPQLMTTIRVYNKKAVIDDEVVQNKYNEISKKLNGDGRMLLRASETESAVRIMVESTSINICNSLIKEFAAIITSRFDT